MIKDIIAKYQPIAVFPYGSVVYQNKKPSDFDFIIVSDNDYFQEKYNHKGVDIEISNFSKDGFLEKLHQHDISILECLLINHSQQYQSPEFTTMLNGFSINKNALRDSISQKSSNSYVKAKKKLIIDEDFDLNVSLKSLWHSLRMVDFGIQIAKDGKITNPHSSNNYYDQISKDYLLYNNDWSKLHEKYKPIQNKLLSDFRILCPKSNISLKI